jgi:hypothetical protein
MRHELRSIAEATLARLVCIANPCDNLPKNVNTLRKDTVRTDAHGR